MNYSSGLDKLSNFFKSAIALNMSPCKSNRETYMLSVCFIKRRKFSVTKSHFCGGPPAVMTFN